MVLNMSKKRGYELVLVFVSILVILLLDILFFVNKHTFLENPNIQRSGTSLFGIFGSYLLLLLNVILGFLLSKFHVIITDNKKKQGQAAIEFLMTYGWAILVVLIAITALAYFGVLNPSRFLPESCIIGPGFSCDEFKVSNVDGITLALRNGLGSQLTSVSVTIKDYQSDDLICKLSPSSDTLEDGEQQIYTGDATLCNTISLSLGGKYKAKVSVEYTLNDLTHTKTGQLVTKVEGVGTGGPPGPPSQTCLEQGGICCVGTQICQGDLMSAYDCGLCCDGICVAPNQAPTAIITLPAPPQTTFTVNTPIDYAGIGTDPEEGSLLCTSLSWSYDIIGDAQDFIDLGPGCSGSFTPNVIINNQPTTYTLRLVATDSGLLTDEATINLTINPASTSGNIYYVSSSTGNDNNPGTQAQPWKTLNKVATRTFSAGDQILFKRGDIWNEGLMFNIPSSGTQSSPITFGAYGSGEKPILSGALDSSKEGWQWTASAVSNYYYLNEAGSNPNIPNKDTSRNVWRLFYLDRTEIPYGDINSLSNGQWSYGNRDSLGYNTIYIRKDSGVPGHVFVPWTDLLVSITYRSWIIFDNIILEMTAGQGFWFIVREGVQGLTLNSVISRYHGANGGAVSGTNVQNYDLSFTVLNSRFHNNMGDGLGVAGGWSLNQVYQNVGVLIGNSQFDHNGNGEFLVWDGDGVKWFWIDHSEFRNSILNDNYGDGVDFDGQVGQGDNYNNIHHNIVYNNGFSGILFEFPCTENDIHHNLVYDNMLNTNVWGGGIHLNYGCYNNIIRYNVVRNNGYTFRANLASDYDSFDNLFVHNTVDGNSRSIPVGISSDDSVIKNNIFLNIPNGPILEYHDTGLGFSDIDYNIFHSSNVFRVYMGSVESWWTLSQLQANTPWCDSCSVESSLDIRNGNDYTPPNEAKYIGTTGLAASIYADGDFLGRPVNLASPTKGAFQIQP